MRLRNKRWTDEYIEKNKHKMLDTTHKADLKKIFDNENEVYLEIGCGKGQFSIENAIKYPNRNFIAMEKEKTVIGVALKKALEINSQELNNLYFLNSYAENLENIFEKNSLRGIYLNFSDPWPKSRHYKKRLTYQSFLEVYFKILKENAVIEIKTDNDDLFNFSIEQAKNSKFEVIYSTTDLYNDFEQLANNIPTEYENKFHKMGKNINKLILKKCP